MYRIKQTWEAGWKEVLFQINIKEVNLGKYHWRKVWNTVKPMANCRSRFSRWRRWEKRQGRFAWAGCEGTKADSTEQLALDTQSWTSPQIDEITIFILPVSWKKKSPHKATEKEAGNNGAHWSPKGILPALSQSQSCRMSLTGVLPPSKLVF